MIMTGKSIITQQYNIHVIKTVSDLKSTKSPKTTMAQASAIATHLDYVRKQIEKVPALKKYVQLIKKPPTNNYLICNL